MKKYLLIADPISEAQSSIQRGIEIAKLSGAALHIVGFAHDTFVSEQTDPGLIEEYKQAVISAQNDAMQEVLQQVDKQNVTFTTDIIWKRNIANWAVAEAKTGLYDMIIQNGHRSESFNHTPSDWKIFRESPIPVLIVSTKEWKQDANILCALDLGANRGAHLQLNHEVIKQGQVLAELLNCKVNCCYVAPIPKILVDLDIVNYKKIEAQGIKKAQSRFPQLAAEFGLDASALHAKGGDPEQVIPSIADKLKSQIIVIGMVGRKGLKGKLIGNTAEKVLHNANRDILAVSL